MAEEAKDLPSLGWENDEYNIKFINVFFVDFRFWSTYGGRSNILLSKYVAKFVIFYLSRF